MKPKLLTKNQVRGLRFRNAQLQESSILVYGNSVKSYFRFLLINGHDDQFDVERIREWLTNYKNAHTYNLRLQGIKEFYIKQFENKPAIHRLRMREAFETIKRKKPAREQIHNLSYLKHDQVIKLASKTSERCGTIIMALYWTGCRISELVNIRLADCKNSDPITIKVLGKGWKERYVFLPEHEYKRIRRVFAGKEYLFETLEHKQCDRDIVSKEIKRQAKRLTGRNVHAHTLRHSKAMYLKEQGLSPDQIAKALGHSDVTVTLAYYLHGTPSAEDQGIR